jgi:hypothetical protein
LDYELMGVGDTVQQDEMRDYAVRPLEAKIAPKFAPLVLVQKVITWGEVVVRRGKCSGWL